MSLPLLLLLLAGASRATHFLGTMMTYYPGETRADGSVSVILRYKLSFVLCSHSDTWQCNGNCGTAAQTLALSEVAEIPNYWCQREGIITREVANNSPLQLVLAGGNWISLLKNNIVSWRAETDVELRNRSDTGKANTSPQSTILPALRIPSNCSRFIDLLAFDPDGDEVKCRYGISNTECNPCTPPSVLDLSSTCRLSFASTSSSAEGSYAVQLVIEDFPRQNVVLTRTDGVQTVKNTSQPISKIPLQFVLRVDPGVPSCAEGLYLPRFLPPTPEHRSQLYTPVGQTLEISIRAEATQSIISELLISGPYNVANRTNGPGNFSLTWTPSQSEDGQSHPICFIVQAILSSSTYHSDLRCVIVTVGNRPPTTAAPLPEYLIHLKMKISTSLSLESNSDAIITQIKQELIRQGLPSNISIRLLDNGIVQVTTAAP